MSNAFKLLLVLLQGCDVGKHGCVMLDLALHIRDCTDRQQRGKLAAVLASAPELSVPVVVLTQSLPNGLIELIVIAIGLEQTRCLTHYFLPRITSDHGKRPIDVDNVALSVRNEDALSCVLKNFSRKAKLFRGSSA